MTPRLLALAPGVVWLGGDLKDEPDPAAPPPPE
jgi:hypothetical protein